MDLVNDYETSLMEKELNEYYNKLEQKRENVRQKLKELMTNEILLHQYPAWNAQKEFAHFLDNIINRIYYGKINIRTPGEFGSDLHHANMPEKAMAYILQQPMEVWEEFDKIMDDTFIQQCINTEDMEESIKIHEKDLLLAIGTLVVAGYKDKRWDYCIEEDVNMGHLIDILEKRHPELFQQAEAKLEEEKKEERTYSPAIPDSEIPF